MLVWVRRFNWRAMSFIGVAVAAISLLAMTLASGNPAVLLLTACVGLGMGALYALISVSYRQSVAARSR